MSSTDTAETMERILTIALNPAIDVSCDAEHVRPTLKTRTVNQKHFAGGGGANVARVIAELGGRAELVYLSGGTTGELYDGLLAQYDIGRHRVPIEGDNRIALMVHELSTNFEYRFVPEGPTVDPKEIEPVHDFIETFEGDYIIASGSLPHGAPADTYRRMAAVAQKKGIRFVLDTSGEALRQTVDHAKIFLLKPSISEMEKLVGERLATAIEDSGFQGSQGVAAWAQNWSTVMGTLESIAQKELAEEALTDEEQMLIDHWIQVPDGIECGGPEFNGVYTTLLIDLSDLSNAKYTIADVHTNPGGVTTNPPAILHVGTGRHHLMVFTRDSCEGATAYVGVVGSFYEHEEGPQLVSLTDEEWSMKFQAGAAPERPAWTSSFIK